MEVLIELENIHPMDFFGAEEENLRYLRHLYPSLALVVRGNMIKVSGDPKGVKDFQDKLLLIKLFFEKYNKITIADINQTLTLNSSKTISEIGKDDVLVHGTQGKQIKALTENQQRMVDCILKNDMLFAIGPAGSGKTYTAIALAVKALKNKEIKRIILTRPAVEAGENLGFLPGDIKEKLDPYLQPLYDGLRDMLPPQKLTKYMEDGTIEIAPLAFMRGRTLDHAFVILDEAQNATENQMKMFLTRMGKCAKFIITGDITQVDLRKDQRSGLIQAQEILKDVLGIGFVFLNESDIVRHELVSRIVTAYANKQV